MFPSGAPADRRTWLAAFGSRGVTIQPPEGPAGCVPLLPRSARTLAGRAALLACALLVVTAPTAAHAETWTWPVDGEVLSQYRYGGDPFAADQHRGIDVAAPVGATVRAATDGTVKFAGTAGDSGLTVAVRTADDRFDTSYLHLDSLSVGEGDVVSEGAELGTAGTTGRRSTAAPHVHFGVRVAGSDDAYRDPLRFLDGPSSPPIGAVPAPRSGPRPLPAPSPARPSPAPGPRGVPLARPAPVLGSARTRVPGAAQDPRPEPTPRPGPTAIPASNPAARTTDGFHPGPAIAWAGAAMAALALMRFPRGPRVGPARAEIGARAGWRARMARTAAR
jgi:hypothetical protein